MPEGKKNTAPVPSPVRDEDGYSAKTHLHQPVQETATVAPSVSALYPIIIHARTLDRPAARPTIWR